MNEKNQIKQTFRKQTKSVLIEFMDMFWEKMAFWCFSMYSILIGACLVEKRTN